MANVVKAEVEAAFKLLKENGFREYLMRLQTVGLLWWAMGLILR